MDKVADAVYERSAADSSQRDYFGRYPVGPLDLRKGTITFEKSSLANTFPTPGNLACVGEIQTRAGITEEQPALSPVNAFVGWIDFTSDAYRLVLRGIGGTEWTPVPACIPDAERHPKTRSFMPVDGKHIIAALPPNHAAVAGRTVFQTLDQLGVCRLDLCLLG